MSEDERALRARLAALEAEVQAVTQAKAAKREARADYVRTLIAAKRAQAASAQPVEEIAAPPVAEGEAQADLDALEDLAAPTSPSSRTRRSSKARSRHRDRGDDVADALALARRAGDVKDELTRPRGDKDKSWLVSGGLSFVMGPVGWLYAGSIREAAPAALAYILIFGLAMKIIPLILLAPILGLLLPLSGIAGVVYALTYNRHGERQRLFGDDKSSAGSGRGRKALPRSDEDE